MYGNLHPNSTLPVKHASRTKRLAGAREAGDLLKVFGLGMTQPNVSINALTDYAESSTVSSGEMYHPTLPYQFYFSPFLYSMASLRFRWSLPSGVFGLSSYVARRGFRLAGDSIGAGGGSSDLP
jgi:hypothetical protein